MLVIRPEQFQVFAQAELRRFEESVLAHLKKFFPDQASRTADADLLELIRYGRERAPKYNLTIKAHVCLYIDLMLVLGRDFDIDPRLPWAARILNKPRDPEAKMYYLYRAATDHINSPKAEG
jgi:hypothetical protein